VTVTQTVTETGTPTWTETPGTTGGVSAVVYPNPVTLGGTFNVALRDASSDVRLVVYSIAYRKIKEQPVSAQQLQPSVDSSGKAFFATPPLDLTDSKGGPLANGLYYVKVETTAGKKTLKLLLMR
jgi:hypothetical protein